MDYRKGDAVMYQDEKCYIAGETINKILLCDKDGYIFDNIHKGDVWMLDELPKEEAIPNLIVYEKVYAPTVYKIDENTIMVNGIKYKRENSEKKG